MSISRGTTCFSGQLFFRIFDFLFCFVFGMSDLVQDVEDIFHLP